MTENIIIKKFSCSYKYHSSRVKHLKIERWYSDNFFIVGGQWIFEYKKIFIMTWLSGSDLKPPVNQKIISGIWVQFIQHQHRWFTLKNLVRFVELWVLICLQWKPSFTNSKMFLYSGFQPHKISSRVGFHCETMLDFLCSNVTCYTHPNGRPYYW